MANPAALNIVALTLNSFISLPAAQTIDANGTVPIDAGSKTDRLIIEVVNADDAALTVKVLAGDSPPALRASQGDLSVALAAAGGGATTSRMIGPFESARFIQDDGKLNINFTAAAGAPNATVRVYRLPKA